MGHQAVGYAFINCVSSEIATRLELSLEGFSAWPVPCNKACKMGRSDLQGLEAHIHRYRNSPLMHEEDQGPSPRHHSDVHTQRCASSWSTLAGLASYIWSLVAADLGILSDGRQECISYVSCA